MDEDEYYAYDADDEVEDRWDEDVQCDLFDAGMYEDEPLPNPIVVVKEYL